MAKQKINWLAAIKILALAIGLIMLFIGLGDSPIGLFYPSAQ